MRKIAIIQRFLPSLSRGGVGHFTHGLASALAARGHQVTVFSQDPAPAGAAYAVTRVPVAGRRAAPLAFPFALRRSDFRGFDVIHAQGDEQWLPRRRNPPVVRTMHGAALAEAWFNGVRGRSLKRFLLHLFFYGMELIADLRADRVVFVSAGTGRYYPRPGSVIPNGIDVERISDVAKDQTKSDPPSILFIGELDSRKRGRWLIEVFERHVRPNVPGAELWLVCPDQVAGPGPGPGPGIVSCGMPDDHALAVLLARAWVMCLPSAYEGFGRPYGEAMAAGTATVASPNPGADDVLQDGQCGVIADDAALGSALVHLLTDARERERLARLGRARAEDFAWPRVAAAYERVYDEVIRARAAGIRPRIQPSRDQ